MAVPNEYPFDKAGVFWKEVTPDATFDETDFSYGSTNDRIKLHPVRYPESNNIYLTSNLSVVQIPTLDAKSNPNIKFRPAINPYDLKENLNFKLRNQFDEYEIEIESEPLLTVFYKPGNIFVYFVKTPATHSTPQNTVYAAIYIANPKLEYSNAQAYYEAYQNKEKFNNAILIEPLILESPKGIKIPLSLLMISSGFPPTFVVITGIRAAMASRITWEKPSYAVGNTNASPAARCRAISFRDSEPRSKIFLASPRY